jgi:DNA-binding NarL/FixJ family response regulator
MQSRAGKKRVYVVDDEPAIRLGLKLLINRQPDLEVCGDADSGRTTLEQILSLHPDLAILDLNLKEDDGLRLTRQLREKYPALRILIFSMHDELPWVEAALKAGANGYLTKEEGSEKLLEAIHALLQGKLYLRPTIAAKISAVGSAMNGSRPNHARIPPRP